jgi:hypothetical protein
MPEYIEREALRAEVLRLTGESEFSFDNCFPYWQFSKCIKEAPAVDAVPVVRCRDCKWWSGVPCGTATPEWCECSSILGMGAARADDFCSYGERKEAT